MLSDYKLPVVFLFAVAASPAFAQFTQQGDKLVGTGTEYPATPGVAVALSSDGNTALVGGPADGGSISQGLAGHGATWVYTRTNGAWSQQGPKLFGAPNTGNPSQGIAVALSADGNTAIVGGGSIVGGFSYVGEPPAPIGGAWIFVRNANGVWAQQGDPLDGGAGPAYTGFGRAVALSADGNTVPVAGSSDGGSIWVFTRNSSGVWSQQGGRLGQNGLSGNGSSANWTWGRWGHRAGPASSFLCVPRPERPRARRNVGKRYATREDLLVRTPGSGPSAGPKSEMATTQPSGPAGNVNAGQ